MTYAKKDLPQISQSSTDKRNLISENLCNLWQNNIESSKEKSNTKTLH
jgi:hypothetical protein